MNQYEKKNDKYKLSVMRLILTLMLLAVVSKTAPATDTLPENIPLQNPGFEEGLAKWNIGGDFKEQIALETSNIHGGAQALKIDASQKNNLPFVEQMVTNLKGGATYRFSIWARVAPGSSGRLAAVKMENYNAAGQNTGGMYGQISLPGDGSWKQVLVTMPVESDAVRSRLLVRVMSSGTVILFDDAAFTLVKQPSDVTIISPQQQVISPDRTTPLSYQIHLLQPWTETALPEIMVALRQVGALDSRSVDTIRTTVKQTDNNRNFTASFPMPKLEAADYEVSFSYRRDGKLLQSDSTAFVFTVVPRRKPEYLTESGTILWNGKPFFPIGMYHPDKGEQDYKLLSENGFNSVQGSGPLDLNQFKMILDTAQKYNLAVDVPLYMGHQVARNLEYSLEKIKHFADHPALLCWKIIDEPEVRPEVAHEVPPVYRALKAADLKNSLELTMSGAASLEYWSNFCDILQIDHYPLPNRPITEVSDKAREALKVMQPWQNLSFVLQSGWASDLSNQPSPAQARSMVYLALVSGAKGIWWYSMRESDGWDLTKTPLWPHLKTINAEIKALSEPVMLGKVVNDVRGDQTKVLFRAFEYQGKIYLLVTNPEFKPIEVTFTVPNELRSWRAMDSNTGNALNDHKMIISLQGIDSQTFILEK